MSSSRSMDALRLTGAPLAVIVLSCFVVLDAQFAAMSIDLGSQFLKIGLIKPGVPMQIVLDKESSRKSPTIVAIKDNELLFYDEAAAQHRRSPSSAYAFLVDLLGKKLDNPVVHQYHRRFPYMELVASLNRGTVVFKAAEGEEGHNPEQLLGMILSEARAAAEAFAGQTVVDAVVSIPGFFNQAERRAMVTAAEIAGLNVLALINDYAAAGLNYGMFRRKEFTEKPTRVLIYDLGASKAIASIFEFAIVEDKKTREKNPQVTVLGVGFDRFLGGLEFSLRLRKLLADRFATAHKTKKPIHEDVRSMTKLFYEAERVKAILSANLDTVSQVESLHEGLDFRTQVTRNEFEEICADLYERIGGPVEQALRMANTSMDHIDHVVLMGAATRMPKFQQVLQKVVQEKELGRYLNADEAIAMGAIYFAAHKIKGFKVKKFVMKDVNLYPIEVHFVSEKSTPEADSSKERILRRMLYDVKNAFPQKKMITFSKHNHDFEVMLNYGDLDHLNEEQMTCFGSLNITRIDLLKVEEALRNNSEEGSVFKGIRAHFVMDDSGIVHMLEVEGVPIDNKTISVAPPGNVSNETTAHVDSGQQSGGNDTAAEHKAKPQVVKVLLDVQQAAMDIPFVNAEWVNHSMQRLKAFEDVKKRRQIYEKSVNELESFAFETGDKLEQEEFSVLLNEQEREAIRADLNSARDWMEDQDINTPAEEYQNKLNHLKNITTEWFYRQSEMQERPNAMKLFKDVLNYTVMFSAKAQQFLEENVLTEVEVKGLMTALNDTELWLAEMTEKQNAMKPSENPVLKVADLMEKSANLDREVRYLLNKVLIHQQRIAREKKANETTSAGQNVTVNNDTQPANASSDTDQPVHDEMTNDTHLEL